MRPSVDIDDPDTSCSGRQCYRERIFVRYLYSGSVSDQANKGPLLPDLLDEIHVVDFIIHDSYTYNHNSVLITLSVYLVYVDRFTMSLSSLLIVQRLHYYMFLNMCVQIYTIS